MKMKLKLLVPHGTLKPGVYTFAGKLMDYLLKTGKAVEYKEELKEIKEEKTAYETKEEKFIPKTKAKRRTKKK